MNRNIIQEIKYFIIGSTALMLMIFVPLIFVLALVVSGEIVMKYILPILVTMTFLVAIIGLGQKIKEKGFWGAVKWVVE